MTILSCVYDLLIWKRREYAKGLIYYELLYDVVISCVPFDYGNMISSYTMIKFIMMQVGYSCNMTLNILAVTITHCLSSFIIQPTIYNYEFT